MADNAPGHHASQSEPPPCYNCGLRGHIFTACPEPTREIPAGLEASRARRQASSGDRGSAEHPNKKHKGPIVTRYSHPSHSSPPAPQYHVPPVPPPYGPPPLHFPSSRPPQPFSDYPPHFSQHAPPYGSYPPSAPPQSYPPPHGHPSYPHSYGPPVTPGPPPLYGPPPGYSNQPPPYGYSAPPPGLPPAPLHGPPPAFSVPEYATYHGHPPPGYPPYAPSGPPVHQPIPPYGHERHPPYPERRRGQSRDDREFRRRWEEHQDHRQERDDPGYSMSRQRDGRHRGRDHREDRRPIDRRGGNKPREERNLNKRDRHRPQNTSVSKPRSIPDNGAMNTEQSRTPLSPWAPSNDDHTPSSRGNTRQEEEVSEVKTDHSIADPDDESEGEITDEKTPLTQSEILEKEFAWDFQKIFAEVSAEHKGDPIGEPLPSEYTEKIMLPPAFDATGIKSKHITSSNLDDFALSVRDGNQWAKYRQHPTFLDPLKITPPHLETYYKSISKGQGSRNDRRDRLGPPPHAGKFHRDHIKNREQRSHRNHGDIDNQASSQRKRKWDERAHLVNPNYNGPHKIPSRPENSSGQAFKANRLLSPEPGELSETSSTVAEVSQHAILPSHADDFEWRQRTDDLHSKFDNDNYYSPALRSYKHFNDEASAWRRSPEPRRQHVTTSRSPVLVRPTEPRHPHKSGRHERSFTKEQRERSNSNRSREHGSTQDPSAESEPGRLDMFDDESKPALGRLHLPPSLPKRPPPRRDSQASKIHVTVARSSEREDRRLSPEPISQPESIGSPLTALEAELLGLGPSSGSESGEKSPIIPQQEDQQPKAKRRQPRVDAAFSRRW